MTARAAVGLRRLDGSSGSTGSRQRGRTPAGSSRRPAPRDSAIALGTLGGTVLLAGAAGALWLTRRNQPARARR